ncbi:hypothetical protein AB6A40_001266 [Gnathostoma spinigerum]|uniref:G-protein coupled receptors family 1 profile domain-containing protein n=1 Tax=Gnathostoma spinigerum TaxID=75299 RepID=A0ABD6EDI2_9BILA
MLLNCSDPRSYPRTFMSNSAYVTSICYSICFSIAFIGNFSMFIILIRHQLVKIRRVYTLLLHMNVAHLVVTLIYMPKEIIHSITVAWWGGDFLCRWCKFMDNFGNALAANILICISLDRFYSIYSPLYTLNAKKAVKHMIYVAWVASVITSFPAIILFRSSSHPCASWFTQCVSGDLVNAIPHNIVFGYTLINLVQVYILPLFVTVIFYSLILYKISAKADTARSDSTLLTGNHTKLRRTCDANLEKAKSRTLRMTFVIVFAFLLCWTPYATASLIHFTHESSPIPPPIRKLLYAFAVFNSAISPYLYGYFSFDLKKELLCLTRRALYEYNSYRTTASTSAYDRHFSRRSTLTPNISRPLTSKTLKEQWSPNAYCLKALRTEMKRETSLKRCHSHTLFNKSSIVNTLDLSRSLGEK